MKVQQLIDELEKLKHDHPDWEVSSKVIKTSEIWRGNHAVFVTTEAGSGFISELRSTPRGIELISEI